VFKNYVISAYRNLLRCKLDSFLNISGLVVGLSAALLIALFVRHEIQYDDFWKDSGRLHRIQTRWVLEGRDDIDIVQSSGPLKAALEQYFPNELEAVARIHLRKPVVFTGTESFSDDVSFADPEILDIYNFNIVAGDARAALASNASIILNESLAQKYFGDGDPIGRTLTLDNRYLKRDYRVDAVMSDLPANSHLDIQALIRIDENDYVNNDGSWMFSSWNAAANHTYFKIHSGIDIDSINNRIEAFTDASLPEKDGKASTYTKLTTIAVPDIHLRSEGAGSMKPGGDAGIIMAFVAIALLIVIVATINYINLSTARAGQRAREVAMRKVMGARRRQLISQHLGESLLLVGLSIALSTMLVGLVMPYFNALLNTRLSLDLAEPMVLGSLFATGLVVGGLSGLYPAIVLSAWRPSYSLRVNKSTETRGTVRARNVLVVFQTAVTVALIVSTIVVYAQLTFFRSLDRGFEPDNLLVIQEMSRTGVAEKKDTFREEVENLPGIASASLSYEAPTHFYENNVNVSIVGGINEETLPLGVTNVDYQYIETLKIPLLAGRFYQPERMLDLLPSTDKARVGELLQGNTVLNAKAVDVLGLGSPQAAIGKQIETSETLESDIDGNAGTVTIRLTIVGVIANTNLHSAKISSRPEVYDLNPYYNHLLVRYSGSAEDALAGLRETWDNMMPGEPFEYFHVDQALAEEFQSETNQANIFLGFTLITLVIACLGLYGLAAFVTECRTREMGIRKILGASVSDIISLLFGQFSWLVIAANLIAWPIVYLLMSDWLQQYPFRIENGWIAVFCVIAGVVASIVVAATVGSQAWSVARANPIYALRQE
jgi:putative ABC transport system permease protein